MRDELFDELDQVGVVDGVAVALQPGDQIAEQMCRFAFVGEVRVVLLAVGTIGAFPAVVDDGQGSLLGRDCETPKSRRRSDL
jgi:hypothetical protein